MAPNSLSELLEEFFELRGTDKLTREKISADLLVAASTRAFGRIYDYLPPAQRKAVLDNSNDPNEAFAYMQKILPKGLAEKYFYDALAEILEEFVDRA